MRHNRADLPSALLGEVVANGGANGRGGKVSAVRTQAESGGAGAQSRPTVSAVIPALNEAKNLPYVLPRLDGFVDEVLIVDGLSHDDTVKVARALRADVRIVRELTPGKGAALRAGFEAARGDIIVMLDADGSTDPAEIPGFVGLLEGGADFVKGSRFLQGAGTSDMPLVRQLGNSALTRLVRVLFGGRYTDLCYGYSAFWRDVVPQLELDGDGFEIETMMNVRALRAGLRVVEAPSFEHARIHGEGNLRAIPDGWRVLKTIARERFRRPPQTRSRATCRPHFAQVGHLPEDR